MLYRHNDIYIKPLNKNENLVVYGQLVSKMTIQCGKSSLFNKWYINNWIVTLAVHPHFKEGFPPRVL
jgi:hypothetical protein